MLTVSALAFLVNIGGAIFNWTYKEAGRVWTQVIIFALALIAALWYLYQGLVPNLQSYLTAAVGVFCLAVAFYEVILGYFPAFSGNTTPAVTPTV